MIFFIDRELQFELQNEIVNLPCDPNAITKRSGTILRSENFFVFTCNRKDKDGINFRSFVGGESWDEALFNFGRRIFLLMNFPKMDVHFAKRLGMWINSERGNRTFGFKWNIRTANQFALYSDKLTGERRILTFPNVT